MNCYRPGFEMCLNVIAVDPCLGRYISAIVSCFLDGMIAFYFARRGENEEKWVAVANSCIDSFQLWESRCVTCVKASLYCKYCTHAMNLLEHPTTSPTSWNCSGLKSSIIKGIVTLLCYTIKMPSMCPRGTDSFMKRVLRKKSLPPICFIFTVMMTHMSTSTTPAVVTRNGVLLFLSNG